MVRSNIILLFLITLIKCSTYLVHRYSSDPSGFCYRRLQHKAVHWLHRFVDCATDANMHRPFPLLAVCARRRSYLRGQSSSIFAWECILLVGLLGTCLAIALITVVCAIYRVHSTCRRMKDRQKGRKRAKETPTELGPSTMIPTDVVS